MLNKIKSVLKNKNVLITGATGGIGFEISKNFNALGSNIFLIGRDDAKLAEISDSLPEAKVYRCDLSSLNDIELVSKNVEADSGGIDILINCAGIFFVKPLEDVLPEDYERSFNINVRAPIFLSKWHSRAMKQGKWGRIFNVGSSSCYSGCQNTSLYCSTKHALLGFSRSISKELNEYGIRICNISPSSTKTQMGKIPLATYQDYETFIDPSEIADILIVLCALDGAMEVREILLNRVNVQ